MPILPPSPQHAAPDTWDTLVIGDDAYPGEATVEISKKYNFEKKKAAGKSGEDKTFKGVETAKLKIKIRVWTDEDYQMLVGMIKKIDPVAGKKKPEIFQVSHATCTARNISYLVVVEVKGPTHDRKYTYFEIEADEEQAPTNKNVGIGGKVGGNCGDMLKQWQYIRATYDAGATVRELDILNGTVYALNAQNDPTYLIAHPEAQVAIVKGKKARDEKQGLLYQMELIRQKMMLTPCPNIPPGITTFSTS